MPAPSLERMCWRPRPSLAGRVAYFVRSFRTCARIRSLTTGTFNLIVKDRISDPPERCESVRPETHLCVSGRPRNPTNISCGEKPVNPCIAQDLHRFSTTGKGSRQGLKPTSAQGSGAALKGRSSTLAHGTRPRATIWPSASQAQLFSAQAF